MSKGYLIEEAVDTLGRGARATLEVGLAHSLRRLVIDNSTAEFKIVSSNIPPRSKRRLRSFLATEHTLELVCRYLLISVTKKLKTDPSLIGKISILGLNISYRVENNNIDILKIDLEELGGPNIHQLPVNVARQLEERLISRGVSVEDASRIAHAAAEFANVAELDEGARSIAFDLAVAAIIADRSSKNCEQAEAQPLWVNRDRDEFPTAEGFLRHHYEGRLGIDGDLTQADLSRLDQALFAALRREFKGRLEELHELLPTLKTRNDAKLMREYGYVPEGEERKSKLTAMSMRPAA